MLTQTQTRSSHQRKLKRLPKTWYNVLADMPHIPHPPLHPATHQPVSPSDLEVIFAPELIEQEMSSQRDIEIPEAVLERLALYRPSPLIRATFLEQALDTPAKILFKHEGGSPPGSHKPNSAIAQAYYIKRSGAKQVVTETGAGQWGSALAFATGMFDLKCKVYMVRTSFNQKPYRRTLIETWGGKCTPSPSMETACGRALLEQDPDTPGSLGMAISEAVEVAATHDDTKYSLGSVLNHVLLHQTVIGLEAKDQLLDENLEPDVIVGCVGGGSNFGGIALPFVPDKLDGKKIRFIAVEPASCPTLSRGPFGYDYGDTSKMTPLMPMHSLGHNFVPEPIHAGGLRYHGMAPIISQLVEDNLVEPLAVHQNESFNAGVLFARTQGYVPAPETCHAIAAVIREAKKAKEEKDPRTILFSWSGHGLIDMAAYAAHFAGELPVHQLDEEEIQRAQSIIDGHPGVV